MPVQCICFNCGTTLLRRLGRNKPRSRCYPFCHPGTPKDIAPDGSVKIPLRARDGSIVAYATVDAVDAPWVNERPWCLGKQGYARRAEGTPPNQRMILLHRAILGLVHGDGLEGDHIDRDKLNCRRSNLRAVPKHGNRQNVPGQTGATSVYRGVSWESAAGKWRAQVHTNRKRYDAGLFVNETDAAEAARAARSHLLPYAVD